VARSTISRVATPLGRVPRTAPQSPPRREAQNASATAAGACRSSSEPCRHSASSPALDRVVEPAVRPAGELDLGAHRGQRVRRAAHRPQHVEGDDVARALPDGVQRRLAVQPRETRLLDVAVAAEHLHRLGDDARRPLAHPELGRRAGQPQEGRLTGVQRRRQAEAQRRRRLALDREVGEHVLHQGLVDQQCPEGLTVPGVVRRLRERSADRRGRAQHAVQPGGVDHLDDRRHAAAGFADEPTGRPVELHLAGGVGPVAELVLEPLHPEDVAAAVGEHPGDEEAGDALLQLGEDEEQVAHRRRGEPLVAGQRVTAVGPCDRAGRVRPDVGAALLLGHTHAGDQAALAGGLGQTELVLPAGQPRLVPGGQIRRGAQGRDDGVGHRRRAGVPHLDLRPAQIPDRAAHVRVWVRVAPRSAGQAVLDGGAHQVVPVRVELHLVDPVAVPVVGAQPGRVLVGDAAPLLCLLATGQPAEVGQGLQRRGVGVADARLGQHRVTGDGVVPDQRRGLVGDLVRRAHARHRTTSRPPGQRVRIRRAGRREAARAACASPS
jgi:hypothetical protein